MSRRILLFGIVLIGLVAVGAAASPVETMSQLEVVQLFDAGAGELPEGITMDKKGNIYVSLGAPFWFGGNLGEIRKISPSGAQTVLAEFEGGPGPAGLAVDAPGNLYFAYPSYEGDPRHGVYWLRGETDPELLPGSENILLPNGLTIDQHGDLFVSDSDLGAIWRIPRGGTSPAENWFQHEWLAGCLPDDPVGANGIAFWKRSLYVANTGKGMLVHIPILKDGDPGEPEIVAGDPSECDSAEALYGMDGIALDVHGKVYALLVLQHKLVRIDPSDGSFTTLINDNEGLFNPASIVFGTGRGDRRVSIWSIMRSSPPCHPTAWALRS